MTRETAPDIRLDTVTAPELAPFEALYLAAFPESERKPFALLQTRAAEGKAELLSIRCRDRFAGLVITLLDGKYALVDYLAVSPDFRNHGIGAVVLDLIRSRYPDRLVFLEIDDVILTGKTADPEAQAKIERYHRVTGHKRKDPPRYGA